MFAAPNRPVFAARFAAVVAGSLAALLATGPVARAQVAQAPATRFADMAAIDQAVAQFTGRSIGVPGGAAQPVDRRLRLVACTAPLALGWRAGAHDSVLVRCPDAGGWRLFVPVVATVAEAPAGPAAAPAVLRGDGVTIAMVGDGFSVEQAGEALDPGPVGGWIRVRTGAKADALRGRIARPGVVEVPVE
ncbi:flagella basal body P-ring formation protein FlgA [Novosphingobium capsulatum]|uniref:flagella basal body P-ring formation protein FlgA n=1 Tax=Novosphingobium capsulatum TaxID=13688 RepID=UPI0009FDCEE8|nr:flagella basal body P-ring formation protein FlgA [Novosphingobium capsulatum]WQD92948.1 flagella basal body P-ring formation protein FlgA [Novosphingobium capsulatum]